MSARHRLQLVENKKDQQATDPARVSAAVRGDIDLRVALGVTDGMCTELREHAMALCAAGKWQACIDVLNALAALDNVHVVDPILMARAYRGLGDNSTASSFETASGRLAAALGVSLDSANAETEQP